MKDILKKKNQFPLKFCKLISSVWKAIYKLFAPWEINSRFFVVCWIFFFKINFFEKFFQEYCQSVK